MALKQHHLMDLRRMLDELGQDWPRMRLASVHSEVSFLAFEKGR